MTGDADGDPALRLRDLLERIVADFGMAVEVTVSRDGDLLTGAIRGGEVALFIGHHGETIDAVRHLAQRIVLRGDHSGLRVEIDAEGYRERRARSLCALADEAAGEALDIGGPVALAPMAAPERRIVHEHLRERAGIATRSEGDEPQRHVVVAPGDSAG